MTDDDLRARLAETTALLERIAEDRALLSALDAEAMRRLTEAAGRVSRPDSAAERKLNKALRKRREAERRASREAVLDATGIRAGRRAEVFQTPALIAPPEPEAPPPRLGHGRQCYVCKERYDEVHHFYDHLCPPCAALNWQKRFQTADLRDRVALVTGARVKIGYQAAISLLRAGARVIVTTRFPRDAAARFAREADFPTWGDRLHVYGLDLRHVPSVETFTAHVCERFERLDVLINNACQTVRRPPGFYGHLMDAEGARATGPERALLDGYEALRAGHLPVLRDRDLLAGIVQSAAMSQLALIPGDERSDAFPRGRLDQDLQQVDLRDRNSWRLALHEVPAVELVEVHLVNAVAPFLLAKGLKPLLARVPTRDAHVVNVSAMEGQFYRRHKTDRHPHTNMAKASLNMLTRTSASDFVRDGIHMNAVDTGWITDEDPAALAERKRDEHAFHPPLDVVDGAARICDPVFVGHNTCEHPWGLFLKDYRPAPW